MGYLVFKDLLLQKRMLFLAFAYVFVFSFAFQSLGEGRLIAIITAVGYMFVMTGAAWEEKNNSDVLWNSLPVAKWKVVASKYLSIFAYVAIVVPICYLVSTTLSLVGLAALSISIDFMSIVVGTVTVFIAASLYLPVFFAVGYLRSRYWHFGLFLGIMVLGSALPNLIPAGPPQIEPFLEKLSQANEIEIAAAGGVGVAVLVAISFLLSVRFYRRREF